MFGVRTSVVVIFLAFAAGAAPARAGGGMLVMEPGPVDFAGAIGGHPPDDGRILQLMQPGSHPWFVDPAFPASQYAISCDTPYVIARATSASAGDPGVASEARVCRIMAAPVVGADFPARLRGLGYEYEISYPFADPGTGRALIFWSDGGAGRGAAPGHQGFARLLGAGWRNQFVPAARCADAAADCVFRYFAEGDSFGAFINRFPSPDRENAARVFQQIGVDAAGNVIAGASVVVDAWLAGDGPPAPGPSTPTP